MHSRFILALALVAFAPAAGFAADCTMEQLGISPFSVIDPCTARLKQRGLTDSEKSLAYFVRGRGYHRTKRLKQAHKDFREAFALDPKNEEILLSWSNVALRQGDHQAYAERVAQAYQLNPDNPHVLRTIAVMFGNFGDREKEMEFHAKALNIDPAEPFSLYFRSRIYWKELKFKEAIADADALVAIPRKTLQDSGGYLDDDGVVRDFHATALVRRANILRDAGQLELAEKDYDAAVAAERSVRTLAARAWYLRDIPERRTEALRDLEEALRLEPGDFAAQYSIAFTFVELKRYEDAFKAFDAAVQARPHDGVSMRMRARMHRQFGRTDEAVRDLETAIRIDPKELDGTMHALRNAGYWTSRQKPQEMTPEFRDAIRACMLDTTCN